MAHRTQASAAARGAAPQRAEAKLADLMNVGPATVKDLSMLGIHSVRALADQDAFELYERLCTLTRQRHDPCVIDVFMSAIDQARGRAPRPWWHYTPQRKRRMA